ncbi:MAG: CDP-alcohol phosphatidyltransferase family protein [Prevotellaceae bacterium]|jgi:CDP-diacylglycerol--glycerol-3-phosphate 3-phosphatidyltransferase|nr:CDP-alcohol phosphatidyltransferase family protein [Prevotellaceae bacterium]
MHYRDRLQQIIYRVINPVVRGMIRVGITPNIITTTGLVLNVLAAALFICGAIIGDTPSAWAGWAGGVVLFAGLFDMMDGRVARLSGKASTFGALYDSVLDRYSELFTLFGLTFYLFITGYVGGAITTFVALIGSLMVSYVRARAEGLGLESKIGLMQRPERVVLTAAGAIAYGLCAPVVTAFDPIWILILPLALIALLANLTAIARLVHCYRQLRAQ